MSRFSRKFFHLIGAMSLGSLGDGISYALLPLIASSVSESAMEVASSLFVRLVPILGLGLFSGVIVDRFDRRIVVMVAELTRVIALLVATILALSSGLNLGLVWATAFVLGVAEVFRDNSLDTMIPMIARDEKRRQKVNGMLISLDTLLGQFVGVALGGAIFGLVSPAMSLGVLGSVYLLSFLLSAGLPGSCSESLGGGNRLTISSVLSEMKESLQLVLGHTQVRRIMISNSLLNLSYFSILSVFVLFTVEYLGIQEEMYSTILAFEGGGVVLGGLVSASLISRLGGKTSYCFGAMISGLLIASLSIWQNSVTICLVMFGVGVVFGISNAFTKNLRHQSFKENQMGKAVAGYRVFVWGSQPIGALVGGGIVDVFGYEVLFMAASAIFLSVGIGGFRAFGSRRTEKSMEDATCQAI